MSDKSGLEDDEKHIIIAALKCLHQLKYIGEVAISLKEQQKQLGMLIEEIHKIRATLENRL